MWTKVNILNVPSNDFEKELAESLSPLFFTMLKENIGEDKEFDELLNIIRRSGLSGEKIFINGLRSIALHLEQNLSRPNVVREWVDKFTAAN